ncbi:hypothetical protein NC653_026528 [Populus alba x Populus x berolinensis]|uniref:Uncharacterized protein n=1 Tax=Populus alba x Populus x berolinensis TaxID=444605 RepID=A0AAD6MEB3_9ROSI|nr:hypothetical protein NC653_026528 [Populus alba x Populus x berolinensis]
MLINYQMLAVEMRRQSSLVVAFSSSQFIGICHDKHECNPDPSFLNPLYLAPSFSSLLHCCFSRKQPSSRPRCACRLWENKNHSEATIFPALMVFLWMLRVMRA